jgi:hypothetical protein
VIGPDEFQAMVDTHSGGEMIQWMVEHPDEVGSILVGSDWSETPGDVVRFMQRLHHSQQEVLARGGGRLTVTVTDAEGTNDYVAVL